MNADASYFCERNYISTESCPEEVFLYWKNLLGDEVLSSIQSAYNISLSDIVNKNFTVLPHVYIVSIFDKLVIDFESRDWESIKSIKLGENTQFRNYYLPLLKFGLFIYKKYSNRAYSECFEKSFCKMLFERLSTISTRACLKIKNHPKHMF